MAEKKEKQQVFDDAIAFFKSVECKPWPGDCSKESDALLCALKMASESLEPDGEPQQEECSTARLRPSLRRLRARSKRKAAGSGLKSHGEDRQAPYPRSAKPDFNLCCARQRKAFWVVGVSPCFKASPHFEDLGRLFGNRGISPGSKAGFTHKFAEHYVW